MATVSGLVVQGVIEGASALGFCTNALYDLVGWHQGPPAQATLWQKRVQMTSFGRVWESLWGQEPTIALRLASQVRVGGMGLLGYAMASSETLLEALKQMRWAKSVLSDDVVSLKREPGGEVAICYTLADPSMPGARCVLEHACVSLVGMCRWLAGEHAKPLAVWTTFSRSPYAALFERAVGVPVQYEQAYDACFYAAETLALPLVGANAQIHSHFTQELKAQLGWLQRGLSWTTRVRFCLEDKWPAPAPPSLALVAEELGCSTRTLQRQLRQEGQSFRDLVQDSQRDAALRLLEISGNAGKASLSIEEIAWQVGFSEASAFSRAFRRWMGVSPGAYRP